MLSGNTLYTQNMSVNNDVNKYFGVVAKVCCSLVVLVHSRCHLVITYSASPSNLDKKN